MIIPVRCYSCGKVIGNKWEKYETSLKNGENANDALDSVGLTRYCCRRMFLSHIELIDKLIQYSENINNLNEEKKE